MTPYPNNLAGNGTQGGFDPFQLFAGDKETVTANRAIPAGVAFARFEVAVDNAGTLAKYTGQADVKLVVVCNPIAADATPLPFAAVYVSAFFNHEALVWPSGVATLAARQTAFQGTEIQVGKLLGSAEY